MSISKIQGIVIKEVNTGEADKIINIFAKDRGLVSAYAKGARRPRSRLIAGTQLLCFSSFVMFKGREINNISSCDLIEAFYDIRNNMEKLTYAAYMLELINDVLQENQSANRLLRLFLNTLHFLSNSEKSPELVTRIFELRFITLMGYAPVTDRCASCGSPCNCDRFSFKMSGLVCKNCTDREDAIEISEGTAKAVKHIVKSSMSDLFAFEVSPRVLEELEMINRRYIREKLEKDYKRLDFLKKV